MSVRPLAILLAVAFLLTSASPGAAGGFAAWTQGGVLVDGGPHSMAVPTVLSDGAGGAFILWADFRNPLEPPGNSKSDVYCQRLTSAGSVASGWPATGLGVATQLGGDTPYGAVLDGTGGLFVLWTNDRGNNRDILLQRLTGAGVVASGWPDSGLVLCDDPGQQLHARMVEDGTGGVHVAWFDDPGYPLQGTGYRTRVLADGTLAPGWPVNGRRHQPSVGSTGPPVLLPLPDGGFYGAWPEYSDVGFYGAARLVGARFDAAGEIASGWPVEGVELCPMLPLDRSEIALVSDRAGGCFVVWSDERQAFEDHDIYAQHLLATARVDPRWPADGAVLSAIANRYQRDLAACEDGEDGFFAAWADYRVQPGQVYALRMRADGTRHPAWPAGGLRFSPADAFQLNPRMTADGMGGAYIAWNALSLYYQAHVQRLDGAGLPSPGWPVGGEWVSETIGDQYQVALDTDGLGGAILAWEDGRAGSGNGYDIYAQRYVAGGVVSARVSLVSAGATPDAVRIVWQVEGETHATVERRGADGLWRVLTRLERDGEGRMRLEDIDVAAGAAYDYRLTFADGTRAGETRVTVPTGLLFALEGARPNPSPSRVTLAFTLAEPGDARLELVDLAGRGVAGRMLAGASAGRQVVPLDESPLAPGLYWAVLTQGANSARTRVVVMH